MRAVLQQTQGGNQYAPQADHHAAGSGGGAVRREVSTSTGLEAYEASKQSAQRRIAWEKESGAGGSMGVGSTGDELFDGLEVEEAEGRQIDESPDKAAGGGKNTASAPRSADEILASLGMAEDGNVA